MGSVINDIQVGQDTRIDIGSYSHGRKRVPMADSLSFTPAKTVTMIGEFDDRNPVLTFETFDGVDVKFGVTQADQSDVDAMVMDCDPNSPVISVDHSQTGQVHIWCNYTGRNTGYVYAAEYAEGLRVAGNPTTSSLKSATTKSFDFKGTRYVRVEGKTGQKASIQYNRFVKTPVFATADDIAFVAQVGTFPKLPVALPNYGGATTTPCLSVVKNGTILDPSKYTITGSTITMVDTLVTGDVVEVWTVTQV